MCASSDDEQQPAAAPPQSRREMLLGYINRTAAPTQQPARIGFADRLAQLKAQRGQRSSATENLLVNRLKQIQQERSALEANKKQWTDHWIAQRDGDPAARAKFGGGLRTSPLKAQRLMQLGPAAEPRNRVRHWMEEGGGE